MTTVTKKPTRLKYRIKQFIYSLPAEEAQALRKKVVESIGRDNITFSRWINLPDWSKSDIPGGDLLKIAECLGVTVDELYTRNSSQPCKL